MAKTIEQLQHELGEQLHHCPDKFKQDFTHSWCRPDDVTRLQIALSAS